MTSSVKCALKIDIAEADQVVVHSRTLIQLVVAGIIALPLPALLAWGLAAKRRGTGSVFASNVVPQQVVDRTPSDWDQMIWNDERIWFGVTLNRYNAGGAPDAWELEIVLWRIQAGWPLRCMEAYWHQDERVDFWGTLRLISSGDLPDEAASFSRPLSEAITNPFIVGLNVLESVRDAPSRSWMPIRPIIFNYLVNAAIYMFVLFALCRAAIYVWDPRAAVRRKRVLRNQCPGCEYAVVGLAHAMCPECGAAIE